ncbi:MAG TPA: hypothetical protein VNE00_14015, partial [Paraburkholderia sp.]|nr:hypothetical protein [Paraburkholderia sp.]
MSRRIHGSASKKALASLPPIVTCSRRTPADTTGKRAFRFSVWPVGRPNAARLRIATFETDISETGEDGTTVRQAEVSEKDLAEVKRSSNGGGRKDADDGS